MHLPSSLSLLSLLSLSALSSASASDSAAPLSADIFYWPLSSTSSKPLPLAQISYDPSTLQSTINSYTPPPQPLNDAGDKNIDKQADLLRIGLYANPDDNKSNDPNKQWVGTLSSLALFTNTPQTLTLHLDQNNHVYHAAISSFASPPAPSPDSKTTKKSKSSSSPGTGNGEEAGAGPLRVEFVRSTPSPSPHLNRPVVLSPDGTAPEEVVEKSLFQKYWWVLGIIGFLALTGSAEGS
ncbi:uncharacterized protein BDCG_09335 [Blastomyces dermatitidis ER-3]|uniref:ER membrane protein complex subunit 10 n=2 Tax=Ajellomyces dermatitidis TaxID=5039 RepID=F2TPU3_AJEDA|nr:uncharacterized protein BDCG_09335 [Blastomyces dermatitidis ER-3]EEQ86066.2 hypothetical protein BDCG_09335 [Blastomyces dermatitidis ER-3]EGE85291.2 hypothetical protein BDDG_08236 [Blastomyces dermatitidis ATCC 18188]EQL30961.1 hypothetical protein BDFG_06596 [Blastomyces dermatitidis ATCC 26199]